MVIYTDSREQLPYRWASHQSKRIALNVGDYTTEVLHNSFHVERKSGTDLYGTLVKGSVRFRNEILRAAERKTILVVLVELPKEDFINHNFPHGKATLRFAPASLRKKIATMETKYSLRFVWCKHRAHAQRKLITMLKDAEKERLHPAKGTARTTKRKPTYL